MNNTFSNEDFDRTTGRSESWSPFETSPSIGAIAIALAKAQAAMSKAGKDSANPFFNSSYADLASVQNAAMPALNENEIAVVQSPSKENASIVVTTMLIHSSGEWMRGQLTLTPKKPNDPQADGGAITYARRYALAAMVGVTQADDDGNTAADQHGKAERTKENRAAGAKKAAATRKAKSATNAGPDISMVVKHFGKLGLGLEWLENRLGHDLKATTEKEVEALRKDYQALSDMWKKSPEQFAALATDLLEQEVGA